MLGISENIIVETGHKSKIFNYLDDIEKYLKNVKSCKIIYNNGRDFFMTL